MFVATILVLLVYLLCDLSLDRIVHFFDHLLLIRMISIVKLIGVEFQKLFYGSRRAQQTLNSLRAFQLLRHQVCDSQNSFLETYVYDVKCGS